MCVANQRSRTFQKQGKRILREEIIQPLTALATVTWEKPLHLSRMGGK
jgi:hypothetical protein